MKKYEPSQRLKPHPHYSGIKFYSFVIGWVDSEPCNRILFDWKIPAVDVKNAIMMYELLQSYKTNKGFGYSKDPIKLTDTLNDYLYQIREYKKIHQPGRGYTVAQYKKIRHYNRHDIKNMYDNHYK